MCGIECSRTRQRLLETKNLDLDTAVQIATAIELSKKENNKLEHKVNTIHAVNENKKQYNYNKKNVTKFQFKKSQSHHGGGNSNSYHQSSSGEGKKGNRCFRCGNLNHKAPECTLPKDVKCLSCGGHGHLEKVCFKKNKSSVKEIEEIVQVEHVEERGKFLLELLVNKHKITFDVDTGAAVTLMSRDDARKYFSGFKIYKTDLNLISYCKNKINVLGYITVNVTYANNNYNLN